MRRYALAIAGAATITLLAGGFYLSRRDAIPAPAPLLPSAQVARVASAPSLAASESKTHYPIDTRAATPRSGVPFDLQTALSELFGLRTVQSMFRLDDFPRRLVATIDNLGRSHARAQLWPVNPASGVFDVEERDGAVFIGADNGLRYTPYVLLLETVDLQMTVALYKRIYPSLQEAYEELGYPRGYFNDRLVEVIDQLLATPETDAPLQVRLPAINGPVRPARPWVLYEFADPAMESLSAGQKILLRMGSINERRIKARLGELRRLLTVPPTKR